MDNNKFHNKKIALIGLSVEGFVTLKYLLDKHAKITIFEQRNINELEPQAKEFIQQNNIKLVNEKNYLDKLLDFEIIFRTPGFPLRHPLLQKALRKGIVISSQIKLFFEVCRGKIIGVTGTKGKGTTASLIYEILKKSGKKVFLGGNIGTPPLSFVNQINANTLVVLELSSFQLEDLNLSPHIAVVLNITSDHLFSDSKLSPNYHLSHKDYLTAKTSIVSFQKSSDYAVLNADYSSSLNFKSFTKADIYYFSRQRVLKKGAFINNGKIFLAFKDEQLEICKTSQIQLRGEHNLENITAAVCASHLAGADFSSIRSAVLSFKGLEHRLEFVRDYKGIKFYNDSFSTTPETSIAAIKSFDEPIILILGGSEKGSNYQDLAAEISKNNVKNVLLIGKTGPKIMDELKKKSFYKYQLVDKSLSMTDIVKLTNSLARSGDVILLSPACASFDMFKNYKDRGNQFKNAVISL